MQITIVYSEEGNMSEIKPLELFATIKFETGDIQNISK